ncbi:hypothetical protein [Microcoleus sp.]|uniref:hypothetical protein n=1 Tax=Microcoleus sp. TaxID=44472 RepID=UPI00403EAC85
MAGRRDRAGKGRIEGRAGGVGRLTDHTDDESLRQALKQTQDELAATKKELAEKDYNYSTLVIISQQLNQQLETEQADRQQIQAQLERTREELAKFKGNPPSAIDRNPAPAIELPEPADLLNQLKGRRKKSKVELADVTAILEFLEERTNEKLLGRNN